MEQATLLCKYGIFSKFFLPDSDANHLHYVFIGIRLKVQWFQPTSNMREKCKSSIIMSINTLQTLPACGSFSWSWWISELLELLEQHYYHILHGSFIWSTSNNADSVAHVPVAAAVCRATVFEANKLLGGNCVFLGVYLARI